MKERKGGKKGGKKKQYLKVSIVSSCECGKDKSHLSSFIASSCATSVVEGSVV
jgi:hypothetical protein